MTVPAFDVVLAAVRALEGRAFTVGAGSTTTSVVDATFASLSHVADAYKGGTLLSKSLGGQANQLTTITASSTAAVYTVSPAVAATPSAGDLAYVLGMNIPSTILLAKLAEVLFDYGDSETVDTSLTTTAGQREYTIPATLTAQRDVIEVELQRMNTSPAVYDLEAAATVDLERGVIVFQYTPQAGLTIRLRVRDLTPQNITASALASLTIPNHLDPAWLAVELAARCATWRLMQPGADSAVMQPWVNDLRNRALSLEKRKHRRPAPPRSTLAYIEN